MEKIKFKDLPIGKEFVFDGNTYVKIPPEKISCCKAYTASLKDNPVQKIIINPNTNIDVVNDQL